MFKRFEIWKHTSCLDMCILIIRKQYESDDYIKYKVMYVDEKGINYHPAPETVKISRKDFWKWKQIS